jgi:hypothetical protein
MGCHTQSNQAIIGSLLVSGVKAADHKVSTENRLFQLLRMNSAPYFSKGQNVGVLPESCGDKISVKRAVFPSDLDNSGNTILNRVLQGDNFSIACG